MEAITDEGTVPSLSKTQSASEESLGKDIYFWFLCDPVSYCDHILEVAKDVIAGNEHRHLFRDSAN